jgi:hypothetical protein
LGDRLGKHTKFNLGPNPTSSSVPSSSSVAVQSRPSFLLIRVYIDFLSRAFCPLRYNNNVTPADLMTMDMDFTDDFDALDSLNNLEQT